MPPKRKAPSSGTQSQDQPTSTQNARPRKRVKFLNAQSGSKTQDAVTSSTSPASNTTNIPDDAPIAGPSTSKPPTTSTNQKPPAPPHKRRKKKITRLAPVRPFPQVPSGSNATGPYSTRGEGKNRIGVTRQMELGAYLRRCKELVIHDGYRSIHLTALGAAIPHALLISTSLPSVLSPTFSPSSIAIKTYTSTVQCVDEIIPDESDDDEDDEDDGGGMQVRNKSAINIDIIIGDGVRVDIGTGTGTGEGAGRRERNGKGKRAGRAGKPVLGSNANG